MGTMPTVENAVTWFNAKTVTHNLDVVDRQAASIVDTCAAEGSTVRFYNADGFDALFDEKLVGTRGARGLFPVRGRAGGPELRVRASHNGGGRGVRPGLTPRTKPTTCFKHDTTRNPAWGSTERKEKRA